LHTPARQIIDTKFEDSAANELDLINSEVKSERLENDPHVPLHYPNAYPRALRWGNLAKSIALLFYGVIGAYIDDIYFPGKRGNGIHFHGLPMWFIFTSMMFAVANMLSVICDHYDRQANEILYKEFYSVTRAAAWTFLTLAFVLYIFRG
jgi:hypothetical protein